MNKAMGKQGSRLGVASAIARALLFVAVSFPLVGCARSTGVQAVGDPRSPRDQSTPELIVRGQAFARIGDLTRGEQYLSAALSRGGDPRQVLPMLVQVCVMAARYRVASEYVHGYLRKDPENARLHILYGLLEAAIGDHDLARQEYETALRLDPSEPAGHYAYAVLLRDTKGDPAAADMHFREYLRLDPDGENAREARASLDLEAR